MIEYSTNNLKWLHKTHGTIITATVEPGDATTHRWQPPLDAIASETYLGRPLSSLPPITMLEQIRKECDELHSLFLANIKPQLKTGTRVCLAVPAWRTKNGFLHLKTLDHLRDLGYTRLSFVHANEEDLIYHRPDQIVARELVILEKN